MADISVYKKAIESASRGEQVRDSIIQALDAINSSVNNAKMLEGHPASYFATYTALHSLETELGDIGVAIDAINGEVV